MILGALATACGGGTVDADVAIDLTQTSTLDDGGGTDDTTDDVLDTSSSTTSAAAEGGNTAEPCAATFAGLVERSADEAMGHTAGQWKDGDFVYGSAVEIGDSNFTTYMSSDPIEGGTVEAAAGGVVVTIIVWGDGAELTPGTELPMTFGAVIDNSGNAQANTLNKEGTITIVAATDDQLCFDVDYTDDLQYVNGRVSVPR